MMTPVKQQFVHNPPHTYGDCHRAALASLLDLPIEEVPNFMDGLGPLDGHIFNKMQDDFLRSRGFDCIVVPLQGSIDEVLKASQAWNGDRLFLLGGQSGRGIGHTVVAAPWGIVHDPHPSNTGISGPMSDGCYWLTYIVGFVPSQITSVRQLAEIRQ